ncbi:MAG: hypothetical protein MUC35_05740 [Candidatus Margulisbacteria bacterium]|jgi:hypothetical protein|nr:hypothetical protein [Candidatus Margulisiibacteriota bacterium]
MNSSDLKRIVERLDDYERRIRAIESSQSEPPLRKNTKMDRPTAKSRGEDLFLPIQKLIKEHYFHEWRNDVEVCDVLRIQLLTKKKPLRASIVNVLRAMVKNGKLIRDKIQKGKRRVFAYKQAVNG